MKNIITIFYNPLDVFKGVKERPNYFLPLILVLVVLAIISIIMVSSTKDLIATRQIEAMKEQGMTDEQIEQAMKIASGPIMFVSAGVGTIITTLVILLIFAGILNLLIPLFGGEGNFKLVFTVVSYSALIRIPAYLLRFILILLKNSLEVSTSLVLLTPGLDPKSFLYKLLSGFDFFVAWEMALVAQGISITNNLKKENAYILTFALWIVSIFLSIGLGGLFGPR